MRGTAAAEKWEHANGEDPRDGNHHGDRGGLAQAGEDIPGVAGGVPATDGRGYTHEELVDYALKKREAIIDGIRDNGYLYNKNRRTKASVFGGQL